MNVQIETSCSVASAAPRARSWQLPLAAAMATQRGGNPNPGASQPETHGSHGNLGASQLEPEQLRASESDESEWVEYTDPDSMKKWRCRASTGESSLTNPNLQAYTENQPHSEL